MSDRIKFGIMLLGMALLAATQLVDAKPAIPTGAVVVQIDLVPGTSVAVYHVVLSDGTGCKLAIDSAGTFSESVGLDCK